MGASGPSSDPSGGAFGPDGDLAFPGPEQAPAHADVVVQIEQLDQLPGRPQPVPAEVDLDPAGPVLEVGEGGLALVPQRLDPSRDDDRRTVLALLVAVERERLAGRVRALEPVGERRHAQRLQRRALLAAGGLDVGALLDAAHAAFPPNRLR